MAVRFPKNKFREKDLLKIKDDCFVEGKETEYGPPPTIDCWLETSNSIFLPFDYVRKNLPVPLAGGQYHRTNFKFNQDFKNPDQKKVFEEAVEYIDKKGSILLALHCGYGKTYEGIRLAWHYKFKTAVFIHRTILTDQWIESIKKFTTAKVQVVPTSGILNPEADFYIFNIAYVHKIWDKSQGWVPKVIGSYKNIGMLIVDEAHIACASQISKSLMYFQPKIVIALTATPRDDGLQKVLDLHFGEEKIVRIAQDPFTVYRLPSGFKPEFKHNKMGKKDWNSVIESLSNHEPRNDLIVNMVKKFKDKTILILTKRIAHCKLLYDRINKMEPGSVDKLTGTKNTYNKKRVLVSTFSKAGIGFDDPRFNMFILGCDVVKIEQNMGRLRYKDGIDRIVIDIVDSDSNCLGHWAQRKTWYESRKGVIKHYYSEFPKEKPLKIKGEPAPKRLAKRNIPVKKLVKPLKA